jgi:cytochrome c peroxidase/predicted amidohydrolase
VISRPPSSDSPCPLPVLRAGGRAALRGLGFLVLAASVSLAAQPGASPDRFAAISLSTPPPGTVAAAAAADRITEAAGRGARYIVLPGVPLAAPDAAGRPPTSEPVPGPTTGRFSRLAAHLGVWLAVTVAERADGDAHFFLTTILFDDRGGLAVRHRAISLSQEWRDAGAVSGSARAVLETVDDGRRRFGVLAGDELAIGVSRLAYRGAEQILVAAPWPATDTRRQRALCRDLARRYQVDLVVAAPAPGGIGEIGASGLYLARPGAADPPEEPVILADLPVRVSRVPSALGLPSVPVPADQELTPALVELGRTLFFDRGLSSTGQVSCSSCHQPEHGFSNRLAHGVGVHGRTTLRNVPSLLNVVFKPVLQWDAATDRLEEQAKLPISGANEMDFHFRHRAVPYLRSRADYVAAFRSVMGVETITFRDAARALAAFQRTLVAADSPFDRYYYGRQPQALDEEARRGLALFTGRARCSSCHLVGERHALFSDFQPHSLGVGYDPKTGYKDLGAQLDGGAPRGGLFITPSLRNSALTAPYMHDGSLTTLEDVVDFYDRGAIESPNRDPLVRPLGLKPGEKSALLAFLRSLTSNAMAGVRP